MDNCDLTHMITQRIEKDTFGDIEVASDRYWGAQTQRCVRTTNKTMKIHSLMWFANADPCKTST